MPILEILNQLTLTTSRNEKEAILKANKDNQLLQSVFKAAYDPTINYYIKKIPSAGKSDNRVFTLREAIYNLSKLSSRAITGNEAVDFVAELLSLLSLDDRAVLSLIITRDLRCGVTGTIANKTWKGLIPEFPYMRCSLPKDVKLDKWDWKLGVYSQLKADALFANLDWYEDGTMQLSTRNGSLFPMEHFTNITSELTRNFPGCIRLHGELQVMRDGKILGREIGNGILNSVQQGGCFGENEGPVYDVWDMIPIEFAIPNGKYDNISYFGRFKALSECAKSGTLELMSNQIPSIRLIPTKVVYSLKEAYAHYFEIVEQGYEGTIIKEPHGGWKDGTSREQVKLKIDCDVDLKVVGKKAGKGKNEATFGSLQCITSDGLLEVFISGFTDAERKKIHAMGDSILGMITTVKFNNIMRPTEINGKYSLFLPRFVELRSIHDKAVADTLYQVQRQFTNRVIGKV